MTICWIHGLLKTMYVVSFNPYKTQRERERENPGELCPCKSFPMWTSLGLQPADYRIQTNENISVVKCSLILLENKFCPQSWTHQDGLRASKARCSEESTCSPIKWGVGRGFRKHYLRMSLLETWRKRQYKVVMIKSTTLTIRCVRFNQICCIFPWVSHLTLRDDSLIIGSIGKFHQICGS